MAFKQKQIFFENIISDNEMFFNLPFSGEVNKVIDYVFDDSKVLIDTIEEAEKLQIWCGEELEKAILNGYCKRYTIKSDCEINGKDYEGPVRMWFFEPDGAFDDQIIVMTCNENGVFKNERYVVGMVIGVDDLDRLLSRIKGEVSSEKLEAAGVPSKEYIDKVLDGGARYTVREDGTIDVEWAGCGVLRIRKRDCKDGKLPLRFGKVNAEFDCSDCGLTTLEGAPSYVWDDFKCNNNKLTSLVGGPEEVRGSYYCQNNQLTSLEGAPKKVGHISKDEYTSFDTGESWVTGYSSYCVFDCQNNKITSLEGVDMHLMGTLKCAGNCISKKKKFNVVVEAGTVRWGKQNLE